MKIGIFAPSNPAHIWFKEKYQCALDRIKNLDFEIVEGNLIKSQKYQGYRTSSPKERAFELMELVNDETIDIIMPVLGGYNTASILPYLDYEKIEKSKKIFCGYSDVTALHLAILSKTSLPTIYGMAVIPSFGEFTTPFIYTETSFIDCLTKESYCLTPPPHWSNEFLNAFTNDWKNNRNFLSNDGWKTLIPGVARGNVIAANINTLVSLLGTNFIPDFKDIILILEEMDATITFEERNLNALKLSGVFDKLKALIFSKPEKFDSKNSNINYEDLIVEIVGDRDYPIIYNFDCGHTHPSISIPQKSELEIIATNSNVEIKILKNSIFNIKNIS